VRAHHNEEQQRRIDVEVSDVEMGMEIAHLETIKSNYLQNHISIEKP
jgi:hypothetical protein